MAPPESAANGQAFLHRRSANLRVKVIASKTPIATIGESGVFAISKKFARWRVLVPGFAQKVPLAQSFGRQPKKSSESGACLSEGLSGWAAGPQ